LRAQELLDFWSAKALRYQLAAMGAPAAEDMSRRELVEAYWSLLCEMGVQHDEEARRWLKIPKEEEAEAKARIWVAARHSNLPPQRAQ